MSLGATLRKAANVLLDPLGSMIVDRSALVDFHLHEYDSYEQYRDVQIRHNLRKLSSVWADPETLGLMCDTLSALLPGRTPLRGLCHGSRNGFEQGFVSSRPGFEALGTDISPSAKDYERSVQWDFHDPNPDWLGRFDFVYSNSLDQSWNPRGALATWLDQLAPGGFVVIEHTEAHGPRHASEMDPFGVRPTVLPYVLVDWFGTGIAMNFTKGRKPNKNMDVWLFFIKRTAAAS